MKVDRTRLLEKEHELLIKARKHFAQGCCPEFSPCYEASMLWTELWLIAASIEMGTDIADCIQEG